MTILLLKQVSTALRLLHVHDPLDIMDGWNQSKASCGPTLVHQGSQFGPPGHSWKIMPILPTPDILWSIRCGAGINMVSKEQLGA